MMSIVIVERKAVKKAETIAKLKELAEKKATQEATQEARKEEAKKWPSTSIMGSMKRSRKKVKWM